MTKKALLSQMHKQLDEVKEKPEKKAKPSAHKKEVKASITPHIPRGERADFLKITLTIPAEMLTELRSLGMRRKADKQKDTDTSALIREALADFLNKHR